VSFLEEAFLTAKIQISVGAITFSGEGTEDWLEKQLDKLLSSAPQLAAIHPANEVEDAPRGNGAADGEVGTLATFLQKSSNKSQVGRFLATSAWLHRKGKRRLRTSDVTKALSEANQGRLSNAADCLLQNVGKGHCEREGKDFYVTPEGLTALQ
jgi:hypothetical protein